MTHKTKGVVLRTVKYGETSVIATVYTELFGVQSYIVKGVRQATKKSQGKSTYFQPGAMLNMVVYHNDLKNLQFIKEYEWSYLYNEVLFDVIKNAVAMYIVELLQHSLKQPEANPELFYLIEDTLKQLNLPIYISKSAEIAHRRKIREMLCFGIMETLTGFRTLSALQISYLFISEVACPLSNNP